MAVYVVDDGGDGTQTNTTHTLTSVDWSKAHTSLTALDAAVVLAAGDVVYIGHNHVCQYTHTSNLTLAGSTSGNAVKLISVTQGSNPPAYQKSSTAQIDTSEGAYNVTFGGGWAVYGVYIKAGLTVTTYPDSDSANYFQDCTFKLGHGGQLGTGADGSGCVEVKGCTVDISADTGQNANGIIGVSGYGSIFLEDITIVGGQYRRQTSILHTGGSGGRFLWASGIDATGLSVNDDMALMRSVGGTAFVQNVRTHANTTVNKIVASVLPTYVTMVNCGTAHAPHNLIYVTHAGRVDTSDVYRTGGAVIEGTACSWAADTFNHCYEGRLFYSPWIYGDVASTGSKTFTLAVANDTESLDNSEAWLEVEYLGTSNNQITKLASGQRVITDTASAWGADSAAWNGSGAPATHKQLLTATATVNQTGRYRARVAISKASLTNIYIDPKVVVT